MQSSDVDAALVQLLSGDSEIGVLAPGGVYLDRPPDGVQQFLELSVSGHSVVRTFGGIAYEQFVYELRATTQETTAVDVLACAARIRALLDVTPPRLVVPGGEVIASFYRDYGRALVYDDTTGRRWQFAGGHYEVLVTPVH